MISTGLSAAGAGSGAVPLLSFVVPTAAVAVLCIVMMTIGAIVLFLGRRGQAGTLGYSYGRFTRATVGDADIDAADAIVARRLVLIGLIYLLGGALMLVDQDSNWIAGIIIATALISLGLLLLTAVATMKVLQ